MLPSAANTLRLLCYIQTLCGKIHLPAFMRISSKIPVHQPAQRSFLGRLRSIGLYKVVCFGFQLLVEAKDVVGGDEIDDSRRRHAVHLMPEDMPDALSILRIRRLDRLTAIQALDDLGDIQAGFHIEIGKGIGRVIEASGVLLFQLIHHHLYHPAGSKDLVRLLRRDIIEDILFLRIVKIIGQLCPLFQEFLDRVVEHDLIEQVPGKMPRLSAAIL